MDAVTCLKKCQLVGVLAFATVGKNGEPQVRNISAIHYESDAIYFFTARGKDFCAELLHDGRVQILAYTRFKEMIRISGKAVKAEHQEQWTDTIFNEQPYLANVYPNDTRSIGIVFTVRDMEIEYFNLGVNPIFRETYTVGNATPHKKGYEISASCIGCGSCASVCPQNAITEGQPYTIQQLHCLHCGNCFAHCPVQAIQKR